MPRHEQASEMESTTRLKDALEMASEPTRHRCVDAVAKIAKRTFAKNTSRVKRPAGCCAVFEEGRDWETELRVLVRDVRAKTPSRQSLSRKIAILAASAVVLAGLVAAYGYSKRSDAAKVRSRGA